MWGIGNGARVWAKPDPQRGEKLRWAKDGIRVNSFSPAGVYRNQDPKFVEQLAFRIPLGRMAFPEEYKGSIVFLASEASSFMTGANLIVDGGRTAW